MYRKVFLRNGLSQVGLGVYIELSHIPALVDSNRSGYITPPIMTFSPRTTVFSPISRKEQVALVLAGVVGIALLLMAMWLRPSPLGYGTHQQLGLPPCTILLWFGVPCPSCGGTTAFAHFVRGQWGSALRANAASCLFAGVCAIGVPWSWASAWKRRYLGVPDIVLTLVVILFALSAVAICQWTGRLMGWVP